MTQTKMLNYLLGTTSKVEILRVLLESDDAMTGRRIAALANISPRSCQLSLDSLVSNRVLFRKPIGRAYSYTVNRDHKMIWEFLLPVFEKERVFHKDVVSRIQKILRPYGQDVTSAWWKIDYTRKGETANVVIVADAKKALPEKEVATAITEMLDLEFGFDVNIEFTTVSLFDGKFLSTEKAKRKFEREYDKIKGAPFSDLVSDKKKKAPKGKKAAKHA